ncbi:hypothetical protein [Streptomyces hypolithicus]
MAPDPTAAPASAPRELSAQADDGASPATGATGAAGAAGASGTAAGASRPDLPRALDQGPALIHPRSTPTSLSSPTPSGV